MLKQFSPTQGAKLSRTPTPEQAELRTAFKTGDNLVIEAGAGTGKTTTLKMLGTDAVNRRGLYVAYNRAIADDAKRDFPKTVQCSTAHSLAYQAIGKNYRSRLNGPRMPARDFARTLRIDEPLRIDENMVLAPQQIARLVMETVARFVRSAALNIAAGHVPHKPGLDSAEAMAVLRQELTPLAQRAWTDIISVDGRLPFSHDCYLKLWQLSGPRLTYDYVMLDEAQDADPVILDVVLRQRDTQLVAVGDRCQAIYGWRGAVDAMEKFPASQRLMLSQSFRFGPAVAAEANKWLSILDAKLRLTGFDRISSRLMALPVADAVLCRSNSEAIAQAMRATDGGHQVALVGGGKQIRALAEAAIMLKAGAGTHHPELFAFSNWAEVQDYAANDPSGSDLAVFVKLIDDRGPDTVIDIIDRLVDERRADVVISTAHKAKGREWDSVRIAGDFREPKGQEGDNDLPAIPPADAMLAYVAVTRAKLTLDREGLAWVDKYLSQQATEPVAVSA